MRIYDLLAVQYLCRNHCLFQHQTILAVVTHTLSVAKHKKTLDCTLTQKSLLGQSVHSYFTYKSTNIVTCGLIPRLYRGIMYFKNAIVCYCTRVNVIFYARNKSTSYPPPIIRKLRMFSYIVYRYLMSNFKQIGQ